MSTIKVTNVQNPSAASAAITLDTNGQATLNGLAYPTSGSLTGRNRIINGDMRIDQRNAGASVTASGGYTLDRWEGLTSVASKFSIQRNAGSVTPPAGFTNYLGATSLSAYSPGVAEIFSIRQQIEGFNISDLAWGTANAKAVVLSFWVRSSLTGTFGGAFNSPGNSYSYPFTYSISAANTWEQKTISVAGPTAGTWGSTNAAGIAVVFNLGAGATYSGTAGSWVASDLYSATGATSVVGTNGATFYITGVQLEQGSTATPFERIDYSESLRRCQRYCWRFGGDGSGYSSYARFPIGIWGGSASVGVLMFHPPMRSTNRTITGSGAIDVYSVGTTASSPTFTLGGDVATDVSTFVTIGNLSGGTNGTFAAIRFNNSPSGYVLLSAEL